MNRSPSILFSLGLLSIGSLGCGGSSTQNRTMEFDPLVFAVVEESDAEIVFGDAAELFARGTELLREGQEEAALQHYELLLEYFPDSEYARPALYNAALCRERMDDWQGASDNYQAIVEQWPGTVDATDALFRWAEARSQLGDYEGVVPLMERVLRRAHLTLLDRIEANVRLGNASVEMHQYAEAERYFRQGIRLNQQAELQSADDTPSSFRSLPDYHPTLVQAHYGLGRTYHELFLEIKLILPEQAIRRALIDKGQLFEEARVAYLDAVRAGHSYWSPAAGFMIGQIYEDFYLDILACEVPHHFDELTVEAYFGHLREYLTPLIQRAIDHYENNLAMAHRMRSDSVWVEETEMGIERATRYLHDEALQEEQEVEIREQRHPHSARDPERAWRAPETPEI